MTRQSLADAQQRDKVQHCHLDNNCTMATIAQDLFVYSAPWQNEAQIASLPYNDGTRGYYNAIAPPPNGIVVVLTTMAHCSGRLLCLRTCHDIETDLSLCATYLGKKSFHGYSFESTLIVSAWVAGVNFWTLTNFACLDPQWLGYLLRWARGQMYFLV